MELIQRALKEAPGWKSGIECYHTYKDGVMHDEKQKINDLVVGVDNQGLIFVTIIQAGRTAAKFVFGPTEWHNYKNAEGNSLSQKEMNHLCAAATADGLREAMGSAIAIDSMDFLMSKVGLPSPSAKPEGSNNNFQKDFNNNNQQGGYQKKPWQPNNGGGQQGGYQKKPWQTNGGQQGGYQKKPWQPNNGGGQQGGGFQKGYQNNNGGGYQKKPWDNNQQQQNNSNTQQVNKKPAAEEIDLDDISY